MDEGVRRICKPQADEPGAPPDVLVAIDAARQHGVRVLAPTRRGGSNRQAIAVRVRSARLHRKHQGVYAVGHPALTLDGRFMAAVLAGGTDAYLSQWATCALAGLLRWDDRRLIDVTVPATRDRPGIRFHKTRGLDPRDTTRIRGIPTTTPARAILEIAPQAHRTNASNVSFARPRPRTSRPSASSPRRSREPTATGQRNGSPPSSQPDPPRRGAPTRTSSSTSS